MIVNRLQKYIALGDSIISDDYPGPNLGAASLLYQNQDSRFPKFHGQDLKTAFPTVHPLNLSQTGWMINDLLGEVNDLEGSSAETLVVISIGGNDLLHALGEGNSPQESLEAIESGLQALLSELRSKYPALTTRLVNAYDPTDGTGRFQSGREIPNGPELLGALNQVIGKVAGSDLVDIHSHFLGHGMRHTDESFVHYDRSDPSGWFKMDIEPNIRGAHEVRRKLWESLSGE